MSKRSVVTSIATSVVLASVLMLSGCGGSSNGSSSSTVTAGGLKSGTTAETKKIDILFGKDNKEYVEDVKGETNDGTGKAASLRCADTKDKDGNPTCRKAEDECSIKCELQSVSCPGAPTPVKRVEAEERYATGYGTAALNYAWQNKDALKYDPTTDMIVYGGAIVLDINGFDSADLKVDVKGMKCGKAINHKDSTADTSAGFANPGHQVFALVKVVDAAGNQVGDDQWTPVDTMDESGNFTIDLKGIKLHTSDGGEKVEVLLFSDKPAKTGEGDPVNGTTGVTGAGS